MKPTHIILTRKDGSRVELTIDEARDLQRQLSALLDPPARFVPSLLPPHQPPTLYPLMPPMWISPSTGDPVSPPWYVTCEARQ